MKHMLKWPLEINNSQTLQVPGDTTFHHVAEMDGTLMIWSSGDTDVEYEKRTIYVRGTGHELPAMSEYIGTVVMSYGLVWHVFVAPRVPVCDG